MAEKCKKGEILYEGYNMKGDKCITKKEFFDRRIIGTTWDIKKARINSPHNELKYAKRDKDKERIKYWTALINIRKSMRLSLDKEWQKNKSKVKNKEDFRKYVEDPAEKKIEKHFKKSNQDLHTGSFGEKLINKCQKKC